MHTHTHVRSRGAGRRDTRRPSVCACAATSLALPQGVLALHTQARCDVRACVCALALKSVIGSRRARSQERLCAFRTDTAAASGARPAATASLSRECVCFQLCCVVYVCVFVFVLCVCVVCVLCVWCVCVCCVCVAGLGSKAGSDHEFVTLNYRVSTTPAREWAYVVDRVPVPLQAPPHPAALSSALMWLTLAQLMWLMSWG